MEVLMTYSEIIIFRLKNLCDQKGISVNKLATLSGITQSTLDNIMKGNTKNPKLKTLHKLAMGLDMTVSELLDFPEMNETLFDDE
jgi:transcriptional regulator with XRE-family HTH domain